MSPAGRLAALREMVAADPADGLARLLLGRELLASGLAVEAAEHLERYVAGEPASTDKGAAYGAWAEALVALGRPEQARAALAAGIENARAHRHLGLVATLEEQRDALP